ncbi:MAG: energy transducer TonB [Smithella sp.]
MMPRMPGKSYGGHDGNLNNMIFVSLICHLIVVTIILVSVPTTSRRLTFGPIYSVQLVGSEVIAQSSATSGTSSMQEMLQTTKAPSAIILKNKLTSIAPTPIKTQDTDRFNIEKALHDIRQSQRNQNNPPTASAQAAGTTGTAISDAAINAQTNEYISAVWSRVKQNWAMPQSLMPARNITTIIGVKIARNGALEYAGFEKRSGNSYFDNSALRAVKKASPFPPLPSWVRDNSIEIGIRFHSAELR